MNAVLIMCHKNPEQVNRLIDKCLCKNTKVFLHCDSKMGDVCCFEREGVYLTDRRIHGELDTRSLVDIAMLMIQKAKQVETEENIHFDYYLLLSGQDYLIKPMRWINEQLKKAYPTPFIDCTPYSTDNWLYHKFCSSKRLLGFNKWVSGHIPKKSALYPVRALLRIVGVVWKKALSVFHITDRHKLKGVDLYGGSAWWILPDKAIDYLFNNFKSELSEKLLATFTPEETYFQTMLMQSPLKELVAVNPTDMVAQNCKTWAYFFDENKSFKGHPYIFTKDEYQKLITSDRWIARKFDITVCSEIFDLLDKYLIEFEEIK